MTALWQTVFICVFACVDLFAADPHVQALREHGRPEDRYAKTASVVMTSMKQKTFLPLPQAGGLCNHVCLDEQHSESISIISHYGEEDDPQTLTLSSHHSKRERRQAKQDSIYSFISIDITPSECAAGETLRIPVDYHQEPRDNARSYRPRWLSFLCCDGEPLCAPAKTVRNG